MILGLSTATFTSVHVALSLIGIVSGVIVLYGTVRATRLDGWTALFLATTVLTSVTAFFFPSTSFGPAHVVGVLSLVVLAAAIVALYFFAPRRTVAVDLRRGCGARSLSQRLRRCRAGVPEAAAAGGAGTNAIGTSVPDCAACRDGDLHRSGRRGGEAVSRLAFEYPRFTVFSLWAPTEPTCLRFAATHSSNECHLEPNWSPATTQFLGTSIESIEMTAGRRRSTTRGWDRAVQVDDRMAPR
jgi:hypothetical protein